MNCRTALGIGVVAALGFGAAAHAETYTFKNITNNNSTDASAGEAQLRVDVEAYGTNQVLFTFYHIGTVQMSITDVYFDDGTLLGIADLIDADQNGGDAGVDFSTGASPGNLPGGNPVGFQATAGFTADSDSPAFHNGVAPGETLGVIFDLKAGKDFQSVIDALAIGFPEGGLVIGIHVQGFEGGGSEAFITYGGEMIPLPAGVTLGAAGLAPLALRRRRRA
jgi:hypothetical protein